MTYIFSDPIRSPIWICLPSPVGFGSASVTSVRTFASAGISRRIRVVSSSARFGADFCSMLSGILARSASSHAATACRQHPFRANVMQSQRIVRSRSSVTVCGGCPATVNFTRIPSCSATFTRPASSSSRPAAYSSSPAACSIRKGFSLMLFSPFLYVQKPLTFINSPLFLLFPLSGKNFFPVIPVPVTNVPFLLFIPPDGAKPYMFCILCLLYRKRTGSFDPVLLFMPIRTSAGSHARRGPWCWRGKHSSYRCPWRRRASPC